jgi:hypothetical protein
MSRAVLLFSIVISAAGCSTLTDANAKIVQANEMATIRNLSSVANAQVYFYSTKNRYASQLSELGASGADLIPADLAAGNKSGYRFQLTGEAKAYKVTAVPVKPGVTGRRTFFSDQTLAVRASEGPDPAGPSSPEVK